MVLLVFIVDMLVPNFSCPASSFEEAFHDSFGFPRVLVLHHLAQHVSKFFWPGLFF